MKNLRKTVKIANFQKSYSLKKNVRKSVKRTCEQLKIVLRSYESENLACLDFYVNNSSYVYFLFNATAKQKFTAKPTSVRWILSCSYFLQLGLTRDGQTLEACQTTKFCSHIVKITLSKKVLGMSSEILVKKL